MQARLDDTIDITSNPSLFGSHRAKGLVSVASDKAGQLTTYRRGEEGIVSDWPEFRPYLWLTETRFLTGLETDVETVELAGTNAYKYRVNARTWSELKAVSKHIASVSGVYASHPDSPQLFINDQVTQYLLATGQTYYNKMAIEEIHSLVLRVYTAGDLLEDPEEPEQVLAVALRDSEEDTCVLVQEDDESKLLYRLRGRIKKMDPDLILGHNLYNRDLDRLNKRCKKNKVKQDWGRDEARFSSRRTRMIVAEKTLDYQRCRMGGRELADSWILAILHDVSGREMMGYELPDVAEHFGLEVGRASDDLESRADKDTKAIATLHRHLLYPYFLQSQIFPLSFEHVILRGNATRIDHLFLRDYFRRGHSIPMKSQAEHFAGGLTAQEHTGCAYGVYHCDVASLYPSLIVSHKLGPENDELGIFTGLLEALRDFRLLAKQKQKDAETEPTQDFFGNLQTTFKILINSFYGYLGFGQGHFADFAQAAEVTRRGREMLQHMMTWLKSKGGKILEVDTDGVYFVPSKYFSDASWIEELNQEFPAGVQVEFDGRYRGMYCHKMKNYALLEEDGSLILRGSGLRSRALEPFLRQFIEDLIRSALTEGPEAGNKVFEDYQDRLKAGTMSVDEVAKTETLIDSPANYSKKIAKGGRNRAAVYELALVAERKYRAGQSLSYYVTGDKASVTVYDNCKRVEEFDPQSSDINSKYYLKKLKATYKKFDASLSQGELRSETSYEDLPLPTH